MPFRLRAAEQGAALCGRAEIKTVAEGIAEVFKDGFSKQSTFERPARDWFALHPDRGRGGICELLRELGERLSAAANVAQCGTRLNPQRQLDERQSPLGGLGRNARQERGPDATGSMPILDRDVLDVNDGGRQVGGVSIAVVTMPMTISLRSATNAEKRRLGPRPARR
jgi:hypothetical protein